MNAHMSPSQALAGLRPGPCPVISTRRLVLRPHRTGDADMIAASLSDYHVSAKLARVPVPYHRQDALDWLKGQTSRPDWTLAMTMGDDVHIGCVGLELRHGLWNTGYWLNRAYWGKGIMTEAVGAALEQFFAKMPEMTVHSGVFADNAASLAVQTKLGFRVTGCSEIYALARNEMVTHIETTITAGDLRQS
ncbi:GNAT family N-acetyltransferase [Pararhizobium sp.]|uniref:GNAT family N-acetyltransferase n=1 Tax=Pararhizobium sp. TaxID=1977563 RepID=UPI002716DAD4|nr:GNAT family N-acetyltransferase [Pararhizobium sp.]MDO9416715.1 GNAT family N-acetyltransferase [Pararhizobium sp.]